MRAKLTIIWVLLLALAGAPARAQNPAGTINGIPFGISLPGLCNPGQTSVIRLFYLTQAFGGNSPGLFVCTAVNVWSAGTGTQEGAWSSTFPYRTGDIVSYMNLLYISLSNGNQGNLPTSTMYWITTATGDISSTSGVTYRNSAGSDISNGITWGTAKLTTAAAIAACPANCVLYRTGDETLSSDIFTGVTKKIDLVMLTGNITLNALADTTIPANISVRISPGAAFTVPTGRTLSIYGSLDAGNYKVFTLAGTGAVNPYAPTLASLNPKWWGAAGDDTHICTYAGTDDTAAFQAVVKADEATGVPILVPLGFYDVHSHLVLTYSATQSISGVVNPNAGTQASGLCASFAGYILDKTSPPNGYSGQTLSITNMFLYNSNAAGGCIMDGASGPPSNISYNFAICPRGIVEDDYSSIGATFFSNRIICNETSNPLSVGLHITAGSAEQNVVTSCYYGLTIAGPGGQMAANHAEVSHIGLAVGIDYLNVANQASAFDIGASGFEGNDYDAVIGPAYGGAIHGFTAQGETGGGVPSGQSVCGLQIRSANRTVFSGLAIAGSYSDAAVCIPNVGQDRDIIEAASASTSGPGVGWDVDPVNYASAGHITYIQTDAPSIVANLISYIPIVAVDFNTAVTVGTGTYFFPVPAVLVGKSLVSIDLKVNTPGTTGLTTLQLTRCNPVATGAQCTGTTAAMLSTQASVDSGENKSSTAATPPVVNPSNALLSTDQVIRFDVTATAATPAQGLMPTLGVQ